jgi:hypothetical protein
MRHAKNRAISLFGGQDGCEAVGETTVLSLASTIGNRQSSIGKESQIGESAIGSGNRAGARSYRLSIGDALPIEIADYRFSM